MDSELFTFENMFKGFGSEEFLMIILKEILK